MDPELGREIGDRPMEELRMMLSQPGVPSIRIHFGIELVDDLIVVIQIRLIDRRRLEQIRSDPMKEENRVLTRGFPKYWIKLSEEILRRWVPTPPKVVGQIAQPIEPGWQQENLFGYHRHCSSKTPSPATTNGVRVECPRFRCHHAMETANT
jgi:hypothetical protein